jgi:hypothetical protein
MTSYGPMYLPGMVPPTVPGMVPPNMVPGIPPNMVPGILPPSKPPDTVSPTSPTGWGVWGNIPSTYNNTSPTGTNPGTNSNQPQLRLIYNDENISMEEKRAELERYRYDEEKIKEQVSKLNSNIESRLSLLQNLAH